MSGVVVAKALAQFKEVIKEHYGREINVQIVAEFAKMVNVVKEELVEDYRAELDRQLGD